MTRDEIKSLLIDHRCDHPSGELLDRLASEQPRPSQDVVEALVRTFRALPLDGDAGCDKLTDDEWRTVALAALSEQPHTDVPVLTPEEEAELVERINSSANLQPRTDAAGMRELLRDARKYVEFANARASKERLARIDQALGEGR